MGVDMAQDEIDGLAHVLGRAALGPALAQGGDERVDRLVDVAELAGGLLLRLGKG